MGVARNARNLGVVARHPVDKGRRVRVRLLSSRRGAAGANP
ncbi:MAG: hypothetical protein WAT39_24415 [Planctomycetota bacterium]